MGLVHTGQTSPAHEMSALQVSCGCVENGHSTIEVIGMRFDSRFCVRVRVQASPPIRFELSMLIDARDQPRVGWVVPREPGAAVDSRAIGLFVVEAAPEAFSPSHGCSHRRFPAYGR